MTLPDGPLIAFLGDDFTGSAATMEVLSFAGLPTVLFLAPPTKAQAARFGAMRGIGIATTARSQSPDWMARHLRDARSAVAFLCEDISFLTECYHETPAIFQSYFSEVFTSELPSDNCLDAME